MDTSDLAIQNLQKMLEKEPGLRDILSPVLPNGRASRFRPDLDVVETTDGWTIMLDVPGVPKGELDVRIEGAKLVVAGSRPAGHPSGKVKRAERSTGAFERDFLMPVGADPRGIQAKLADGVLTVKVPRAKGGTNRVEITS